MAAPEYADFALRFPRLVADPVPTSGEQDWLDARLGEAHTNHPYDIWKSHRTEAVLLAVAHAWTRMIQTDSPRGRHGGALTSKSVGGWSQGWSQSSATAATSDLAAWLSTSEYGVQYLALRASIPHGPIVARSSTARSN
jgi:hypothetical protein